MRKNVTKITYDPALSSYVPHNEIHPLGKKETRYDLDFGQHGRPALHDSRYTACDVMDIHSGVRRAARAARRSTITRLGLYWITEKELVPGNSEAGAFSSSNCFYPEGHTGHAVLTDV